MDVRYQVHRHDDQPMLIRGPQDFADALGYDISRITKSLFLRAQDGSRHAMVVCAADRRVDLRAVAQALGCRRMEVASVDELAELVGYPPKGVSPFGLPGGVDVLVDESLAGCPTVLVGGGDTGVEIEVALDALIRGAGARLATVTK